MLSEKVLRCLEENKGRQISGGQLALKLGVSRTAVWKSIHSLQEKGHEIISIPNSGYQLAQTSDGLSDAVISEMLTTQMLGRQLEMHESLTSTNTYLKNQNLTELPEGYTVIADEQTSGRGRFGRVFSSPAHEGIYLSVLLKPDILLQNVSMLTICAAVAVCRAVEKLCEISPSIKWVNDVFIGDKKLCGILTEATLSAELQKIESVIVGIGINTGAVDKSVGDIAVSIFEKTGQQGLRNRLIAQLLGELETLYIDLIDNNLKDEILAEYSERLMFIRKKVTIKEGDKAYIATVLGVDESGALLVTLENKARHRVTSGEIIL